MEPGFAFCFEVPGGGKTREQARAHTNRDVPEGARKHAHTHTHIEGSQAFPSIYCFIKLSHEPTSRT